MKHAFSWLLLVSLLVSILPLGTNAAEHKSNAYFLDNGCYILVEVIESNAKSSGSKTGAKKYTYYDANSVAQWQSVLTGTFTYTGTSSSCTSADVDTTIYDSSWYISIQYATKSGNKASASVTIGKRVNSTTITKIPITLTLSCDSDGNLS